VWCGELWVWLSCGKRLDGRYDAFMYAVMFGSFLVGGIRYLEEYDKAVENFCLVIKSCMEDDKHWSLTRAGFTRR